MSMNFTAVNGQAETFFDSFNILGFGLIPVWIVGSYFLASQITKRSDEKTLATMVFMMCGGLLFFATDPGKFLLLISSLGIAVFGLFKIMHKKITRYYDE